MFKPIRKTEAFIDISNLALGGFLFLSPWIFDFKSDLGWHTSWIAGTAIIVIAISRLATFSHPLQFRVSSKPRSGSISLSACGWRRARGSSVSTATQWLCKSIWRWGWSLQPLRLLNSG